MNYKDISKMVKGDVVEGKNRDSDAALHYIVFWEDRIEGEFIGLVLTHCSSRGNIKMSEDHFKTIDSVGRKYKFQYDNTHFVPCLFRKPEKWGPFKKIGELTQTGLLFAEKEIGGCEPITWDEYIIQSQTPKYFE